MIEYLEIARFLDKAQGHTIIDVRTPAEYSHAHIPGALHIPIFDDKERAEVGTLYKQVSREAAIKLGLELFGSKMSKMVDIVECHTATKQGQQSQTSLFIHCWRGGMRSGGVAWLMDLYGFKVYVLQGGYKSFRTWVLDQLHNKQYDLRLLSGYTGSGKTEILSRMASEGKPVLDLEKWANHKGSAYGHIGQPTQPSQEMYENLLAVELYKLTKIGQPIWVEDESQRIGLLHIPKAFHTQMEAAPMTIVESDFETRLQNIMREYGELDVEELIAATTRIEKKLGGLETKKVIDFLRNKKIKEAFTILLEYYDKQYDKSQERKNRTV